MHNVEKYYAGQKWKLYSHKLFSELSISSVVKPNPEHMTEPYNPSKQRVNSEKVVFNEAKNLEKQRKKQ